MDPQLSHHQPKAHLLHFLVSSPITVKRELAYALSCLLILIPSLVIYDHVGPFEPWSLFRFGFLSQIPPSNQKPFKAACDYARGRWVRDASHKLRSYAENCPFLDPGFRCQQNGRKDVEYLNWRWQPDGCDLPRFNAGDLLERSRNGRVVFAGDSIVRNHWESFICMLAQGVSNMSTIYEKDGKPITKHKGFLSIRFQEYNLTVEYYRVPFLVIIGRPPQNSSNEIRSTIRVDELHWFSKQWAGANVLVFGTGHWWNEEKTTKMGCHFQEGGKINMTMDVREAFSRSLQTWKSWALQTLDPERSHIFFRSFSPVHYRNGSWNLGGQCDTDMEPEMDYTKVVAEPWNNQFISNAIKQMEYENRKVQYLNITYLTEFRKDGHPSLHREPGTPIPAPQDCSHWCLPGMPDTWNELLYAYLLSMGFQNK